MYKKAFGLLSFFKVIYAFTLNQTPTTYVDDVDILIGGGSLSALAATITAANLTRDLKIVLLEPTDWPGGQLTSSSVPPDFGPANG